MIISQFESAGFDRKQAEALVESFDADLDQLATTDVCRAMLVQTFAIAGTTEAKAKTIVDVTLTSIIRDDQWSKATKAREARRTLTAASFAKVKVEAIVDVLFEDPDLPYRHLKEAGFDEAQTKAIVGLLHYVHRSIS